MTSWQSAVSSSVRLDEASFFMYEVRLRDEVAAVISNSLFQLQRVILYQLT